MDQATCPYCQQALAKMPLRKSKCKHCGETIFVKKTPEDDAKRLVTAEQAEAIDRQWDVAAEEHSINRDVMNWRLNDGPYRNLIAQHGGNRKQALMTIHAHRATVGRESPAALAAWRASETDEDRFKWARLYFELDLEGLAGVERAQGCAGIEIRLPPMWPPAVRMLQLAARGLETEAIAAQCGYSAQTVAGVIARNGFEGPVGPQCHQLNGRILSVAEAQRSDALPCGPRCVCTWVPVPLTDPRLAPAPTPPAPAPSPQLTHSPQLTILMQRSEATQAEPPTPQPAKSAWSRLIAWITGTP